MELDFHICHNKLSNASSVSSVVLCVFCLFYLYLPLVLFIFELVKNS